jgi:peroxiredoxin
MKKRLVIMLSCALIGVLLFSVFMLILRKNQEKEKQKALTAILPIFSYRNIKGNFIDNNQLRRNTSSVFVAFHPECEHCQYEAKSINEKQRDLQNTNVVLFTSASDSLTKAFSKTYGLDTLKNLSVLSDPTRAMERQFDVKAIPTVFIYNAQNQLVKRYNGETKIEAILKALAFQSN